MNDDNELSEAAACLTTMLFQKRQEAPSVVTASSGGVESSLLRARETERAFQVDKVAHEKNSRSFKHYENNDSSDDDDDDMSYESSSGSSSGGYNGGNSDEFDESDDDSFYMKTNQQRNNQKQNRQVICEVEPLLESKAVLTKKNSSGKTNHKEKKAAKPSLAATGKPSRSIYDEKKKKYCPANGHRNASKSKTSLKHGSPRVGQKRNENSLDKVLPTNSTHNSKVFPSTNNKKTNSSGNNITNASPPISPSIQRKVRFSSHGMGGNGKRQKIEVYTTDRSGMWSMLSMPTPDNSTHSLKSDHPSSVMDGASKSSAANGSWKKGSGSGKTSSKDTSSKESNSAKTCNAVTPFILNESAPSTLSGTSKRRCEAQPKLHEQETKNNHSNCQVVPKKRENITSSRVGNSSNRLASSPLVEPMTLPSFPMKLHCILQREDCFDIIHFLPHGRSWRIADPYEFEESILGLYFGSTKMNSFLRQGTYYFHLLLFFLETKHNAIENIYSAPVVNVCCVRMKLMPGDLKGKNNV